MSSKTIGAACLVAGVTIGGGMLALPLTVSALGVLGGTLTMVLIWLVMYVVGLYGLELNLRAGQGMTLGGLGQYFSGPIAGLLGDASLLVLTYALMTAYLFGGASVLESLVATLAGARMGFESYSIVLILGFLILILTGHLGRVDHHNRLLFGVMLVAMAFLILGLLKELWQLELPSIPSYPHYSAWQVAIPVIFTSFGYHIIQNTMVAYCDYNTKVLKRAFFWGSLIPLVAYVSWIGVTLCVLWGKNPDFYRCLVTQQAQLGALMQALSQAANVSWLQPLSWVVGFLAIITSAIGVGLAIISFWEQHLPDTFHCRFFTLSLTLVPPFLIGLYIPGVFIGALGFAGMILTVIAIFMPVYLLAQADRKDSLQTFYPITRSKILRLSVVMVGLIVMGCEFLNLIKS